MEVPGEPRQPRCLQQTFSEMILKEMEKWTTEVPLLFFAFM